MPPPHTAAGGPLPSRRRAPVSPPHAGCRGTSARRRRSAPAAACRRRCTPPPRSWRQTRNGPRRHPATPLAPHTPLVPSASTMMAQSRGQAPRPGTRPPLPPPAPPRCMSAGGRVRCARAARQEPAPRPLVAEAAPLPPVGSQAQCRLRTCRRGGRGVGGG